MRSNGGHKRIYQLRKRDAGREIEIQVGRERWTEERRENGKEEGERQQGRKGRRERGSEGEREGVVKHAPVVRLDIASSYIPLQYL